MTPEEFGRFADLVQECCGIHMPCDKLGLLNNRLRRRISTLGLDSFATYFERVTNSCDGGAELPHFIAAVTTNETYFFRNDAIWRHFTDMLIPQWAARDGGRTRGPRIWSAAASSGEEAYTAAILLLERLPGARERGVEITGTDICSAMIARAQAGVYQDYAVSRVPAPLLDRWFTQSVAGHYQLHEAVRTLARFEVHDVRDDFKGAAFDLVLLCNVLMYFDAETRIRAIDVALNALAPGGHLYVGDVDPIRTLSAIATASNLHFVCPGVYRKTERAYRPAAPNGPGRCDGATDRACAASVKTSVF